VVAPPVSLRPPLAAVPAVLTNTLRTRLTLLVRSDEEARAGSAGASQPGTETGVGLTLAQAMARAQSTVESSLERVVTATGELDALRYGDLLDARGIVGVRGAGWTNDGSYYVESVTHSIRPGEYKQRFSLSREGTGSLLPLVRP
jgi:hypothetical protein